MNLEEYSLKNLMPPSAPHHPPLLKQFQTDYCFERFRKLKSAHFEEFQRNFLFQRLKRISAFLYFQPFSNHLSGISKGYFMLIHTTRMKL